MTTTHLSQDAVATLSVGTAVTAADQTTASIALSLTEQVILNCGTLIH